MKKLTFVVFCLLIGASAAMAQTADLLITEYLEGSGNNKALELYNGTEDVINLGDYTINRYSNGSSTAATIALDAVDLGPGEVFVIANSSSEPALLALADQTSASISFNGDDALTLVLGGTTVVDSFGQVGFDPGSAWSCVDGTTANHTLRRLSSICEGNLDSGDVFDPCVEWSISESDLFTGLGDHIADCGTVAIEATSWGQMKASFR